MRRLAAFIPVLVLISACNLNNSPATPTAPVETLAPAQTAAVTRGVTPLPENSATPTLPSAITRTPFGSSGAPTPQTVGTPGAFPTSATGERAEITSPAGGAVVDAARINVTGVAHNLSAAQLTLQVYDAIDNLLVTQAIPVNNPNSAADITWAVAVAVRGYSGAAQLRVTTLTASGTSAVIAATNITLVTTTNAAPVLVNPAAGSLTGSISSPADGTTVTVANNGITVNGTAGGIADNQFTLELLDAGGGVINSQTITLTGAEQYTVPWSASMGTSGYHGKATLRAVVIQNGQVTPFATATVTLQ